MARLWVVRAGRHGERELKALSRGIIAPGFIEVDDLTAATSRDAIAHLVARAIPEAGLAKIRNFSAQLNQFRNTIAIDDLVVLPRKITPGVAIGVVTGPYAYDADPALRHIRTVEWKRDDIPRQAFKQDLRFSFGAFMTVCEIQRNEALKRVQAVLQTGRDPGAALGKAGKIETKSEVTEHEDEDFGLDIEEVASQQLIALIKSEFAGHALANLVEEILQVDGFKTRLSPPGPDGSRDILAIDGQLGLGGKRICVQVKSGENASDNKVVLALQGAMTNSRADHGLLVSLGGVTAPAQKILDDAFFNIRLWQMPELLAALYRTYGQLSDETRGKLPLKQIWIPVPTDEE